MELLKHWHELEAAGIPLEPLEYRVGIDPQTSGAGLTIRAGRGRWRSQICELKNGCFAYILPVFVRRDRPGKTIIRDCWISPPWVDAHIEWLDDPRAEGETHGWYNLPDDTQRLARETVLNHRMHGALSRGDVREGLLLAVGPRLPETYKHDEKVIVTFTLLDQWDCEHSAKLDMRIQRRAARPKPTVRSTRGPLFSRRDVIPERKSLRAPPDPTEESRKKQAEASARLAVEALARFGREHPLSKTPIEAKIR